MKRFGGIPEIISGLNFEELPETFRGRIPGENPAGILGVTSRSVSKGISVVNSKWNPWKILWETLGGTSEGTFGVIPGVASNGNPKVIFDMTFSLF